jgi:Tfp pilus assembly protein PilV
MKRVKSHARNFRRIGSRVARRGMSLMEVMIATTLLLASVMALSQVAFVARRHAVGAEERTRAQEIAQNLMEEILAGARPAARVTPTPLEEDEQWVYMIQVEDVEGAPLARVTVQVDRIDEEDESARMPTEDEMGGFRLVHWVRAAPTAADSTGLLNRPTGGEEGARE